MAAGYARLGERWYYLLHPRPAYILAAEANGKANFMAASWVMPFSEDPPRIVAALEKDALTTELIRESRAFTINVYSIEDRDFVYTAGTTSGRRIDKVRELGVKLEPTSVGAPRIAEPRPLGWIAARLHRVLEDLADDVDLVVADVVEAWADERLFHPRYGWELKKTRILMHAAGRAFTTNNGLYIARNKLTQR